MNQLSRNGFLAALFAPLAAAAAVVPPPPQSRVITPVPTESMVGNERLGIGGFGWMTQTSDIVDGKNRVFALWDMPMAGSVMIFQNGLLMSEPDDYLLAGQLVTFAPKAIPAAGAQLRAYYRRFV